jgi:cytochrome bd-type quinol oxidase subunit 1
VPRLYVCIVLIGEKASRPLKWRATASRRALRDCVLMMQVSCIAWIAGWVMIEAFRQKIADEK